MNRKFIKPGVAVLGRNSQPFGKGSTANLKRFVVYDDFARGWVSKRWYTKSQKVAKTLFAPWTKYPYLTKKKETLALPASVDNKRLMSSDGDSFTKVKRIYLRSPYKWFDIKVKLFLLRRFFDRDFDEHEFLTGARQAICLVSSFISKGNFNELVGMLTEKATEMAKNIHQETNKKEKLEIVDEIIDNISLSNMAFIYDEKGGKWVDILVTCHCAEENSTQRRIGNIDLASIPSQRIFNFSFVREFTPGVTADWIIDRIAFSSPFSDD
ncbi:m-AAA protease-interacting protein 1, mitochondrial-like isoform X1 [Rhopilema esculentum]|uniref:m-AAA protease-interacting protein 1, mitochondrial-like isoform X1 n=1 Tax=Rhopilema esculentum TaxID=499914 RepID=UPI0031E05DB7